MSTSEQVAHARSERTLIGWYEYVDLPDWHIRGLRAKVDTGARTSALHVDNIEELPHGRVRFDIVRNRRRPERHVRVEAHVVRRGRVRSSTGHRTTRLFVRARLALAGIEREVEFSLVDRERMIFRVLLGRTALSGQYVVDVGHRAMHSRRKKKARRRTGA